MLQLRFTSVSKAPMWLVAPKYTFGSANECDCVIADEGLKPFHAEIRVADERVTLVRCDNDGIITVNGENVGDERVLTAKDTVHLGEAVIEVVDPKTEPVAKRMGFDQSEKTNLRPALSLSNAALPTWHLRPLNTTLTDSNGFELKGSMLLGRSKECDICIAASHLSRKHAKFTVTATGLHVEDLGSSNGTFINGKRIERVALHHGDEVSFDTLRFRVESQTETEDVTTLRPALDETQIRKAVTSEQVQAASGRRAPPVRPKGPAPAKKPSAPAEDSVADTIKLLASAIIIVGVVAWLAWFLLT